MSFKYFLKLIVSRFVYFTNVNYVKYCKQKYQGKILNVGKLTTDGVELLPNVFSEMEIEKIGNDVRQKFSQADQCVSYKYGKYTDGLNEEFEAIYLKPEGLEQGLYIAPLMNNGIIEKLERELGTYFYIRQVTVMKVVANKFDKHGSFAFHRDSHPTLSYKLLVYLTDVGEGNGPTAYIPGTHVGPVYPFDLSESTARQWAEKEYSKHSVVGEKGTALLFNVNGLHAGGRIKEGERIVLIYNFQPTHKKNIKVNYQKYRDLKIGSWEFDLLPWF